MVHACRLIKHSQGIQWTQNKVLRFCDVLWTLRVNKRFEIDFVYSLLNRRDKATLQIVNKPTIPWFKLWCWAPTLVSWITLGWDMYCLNGQGFFSWGGEEMTNWKPHRSAIGSFSDHLLEFAESGQLFQGITFPTQFRTGTPRLLQCTWRLLTSLKTLTNWPQLSCSG